MKIHISQCLTFVGLGLIVVFLLSGCGLLLRKEGAFPPQSAQKHESPTALRQEPVTASSSSVDTSAKFDALSAYSSTALKARKFDELTSKMDEARRIRERIPGGFWKLFVFYQGIQTPNFDQNASEPEWQRHLARLQEWKQVMPNSITARVALAQSLIAYGFEARGQDTIDKVSDESIQVFQERVAQGLSELNSAKDLTPKCPQWYTAMLRVGLAQGWNREKYENVFEEGFQLEPTYYHLQREKITYLQPQWMGRRGDIAQFVNSMASRIGGDEGSIMYFELASTLQPDYRSSIWLETGLEWGKAKVGYEAMKRIYGVDRYRKNLFMAFTLSGNDWEGFDAALSEVGDDWDSDVWGTRERFDQMKNMMRQGLQMRKNDQQGKPPFQVQEAPAR